MFGCAAAAAAQVDRTDTVQLAPLMRPLIFISTNATVRSAFEKYLLAIPAVLSLLLQLLALILFAGWIALPLFVDMERPYDAFRTYRYVHSG
jgi:hypothetical protein